MAQNYFDATASIGLEENHDLADLLAFSSCKGLFGLTEPVLLHLMIYKFNQLIHSTWTSELI